MLSRIVPPNSVASCATSPICSRRLATVTSRMSRPSIRIAPGVHVPQAGDEPHERRLARTRTARPGRGSPLPRSPGRRSAGPGRSGSYPNVTPSSVIRPSTRPIGTASARSRMVGRVSMISKTRWTAPVPSRNWPYRPAIVPKARPDRDAVQQEPGQRPDPERPVDDLVPGVPEQQRDRPEPEEAHQRAEPRPPQREPRAGRRRCPRRSAS